MATKDTPAPADTTPQKSYLPTTQTGLQDYAYWWEYARKQAKKGKGVKDFRRGRIWT
ncbi:cyanobactin biosynthesis PatC/TenC/TruC family protein [Phormidium sp. FACHB-1136]|nr:cyanobactin biosynthesis PatC/TenC/TruC family protein [Phormidium sp. FACHB-1136]